MDTDYLELTIKDGNNEFLYCTFQNCGVSRLKNAISEKVNIPKFDLYKNNVHPKNLLNTNDSLGHYFDIEKDNNKTVIVHPTTPKTPSTK
jgi:hypothetical protein